MIYLSVLVGLLLVLSAEARVGNSSELSFCTETTQCLLYDPICKTGDYEVRYYSSVKWVSTNETTYFMEIAAITAIRRLYGYITGENENGEKIEMTYPVVMNISEREKLAEMFQKHFTMSFLLPSEHQANPPKPTDEGVYIEKKPAMKVYVQSYGGWITSISDKSQASSLASNLIKRNADFVKGFHYAVGYNSPLAIFNRHNEVWYLVKDDEVCDSSSEETEFSALP